MGDNMGLDWGSFGANNPNSVAYNGYGLDSASSGMGGGGGAAAGAAGGGAGLAIGAGLGILSAIGQQNAYQAKMKQLATTTRYSPWTHMSMQQPDVPNALGTIMGAGAGGAALGQGMNGGSMLPAAVMMAGG